MPPEPKAPLKPFGHNGTKIGFRIDDTIENPGIDASIPATLDAEKELVKKEFNQALATIKKEVGADKFESLFPKPISFKDGEDIIRKLQKEEGVVVRKESAENLMRSSGVYRNIELTKDIISIEVNTKAKGKLGGQEYRYSVFDEAASAVSDRDPHKYGVMSDATKKQRKGLNEGIASKTASPASSEPNTPKSMVSTDSSRSESPLQSEPTTPISSQSPKMNIDSGYVEKSADTLINDAAQAASKSAKPEEVKKPEEEVTANDIYDALYEKQRAAQAASKASKPEQEISPEKKTPAKTSFRAKVDPERAKREGVQGIDESNKTNGRSSPTRGA